MYCQLCANFFFACPTSNVGMQSASLVGTGTRCAHVFTRLGTDLHAQSTIVNKNFPRRRSGGSLLRVRCWLGVQNFNLFYQSPTVQKLQSASVVRVLLCKNFNLLQLSESYCAKTSICFSYQSPTVQKLQSASVFRVLLCKSFNLLQFSESYCAKASICFSYQSPTVLLNIQCSRYHSLDFLIDPL